MKKRLKFSSYFCFSSKISISLFNFLSICLLLVGLITLIGCSKKTEELKIGAIIPLTGNFASYGEPVRDGMLLAIEEINGKKNNTKPIRLVIEDDAGDPKTSVNAFNKLASIDKVPIVLGPLSSGCSMATAPIAENNKVVQISTLAGIPALSDAGDYVFRIYPSSELGARFSANQAKSITKANKYAILYMNNPFGQTARKIYEDAINNSGGKIVAVESFSDGDQDFRTQITKIKKENPEVLLCSAYWAEGSRILVQMQESKFIVPVFGEDGWRGPIADIVGENGLKMLYFADIAFGPDFKDDEVMQSFIKSFENKYKKRASTYAATGYDAVYLAKKAIDEAGYQSESIKNTLYKIDFNGALGKLKYDSRGDNIGVSFAIFKLDKENNAILVK